MTILWRPDPEFLAAARLTDFARGDPRTAECAEGYDFARLHAWSLERSDAFWSRLWDFCQIIGEKGERVLADGARMPGARWFPDARLNFAENLLRPRADDETAIVFQGERQARRTISFGALKRQVAALAGYLQANNVGPGGESRLIFTMDPRRSSAC